MSFQITELFLLNLNFLYETESINSPHCLHSWHCSYRHYSLFEHGVKSALQPQNSAILLSLIEIFRDLGKLKEAFKNFNSENIPEMAKEVRTNFVFYEDKDLELILEDVAITLLNFYATVVNSMSVFARLKAYFNTVPVPETPKLLK